MKLRWGLYLAILLAPAVGASTIDVSAETRAVVRTGDTLVFHMFTWNFCWNVAHCVVPVYPTDVSFALVSAPLGGAGGFAATLESADRAVSVVFGNQTFRSGSIFGNGYAGEVSTLQGYLHLSPSLSETLFSAPSAVLAFRNVGPDVTIGLAPYLLRQDLFASLSGGSLTVGAIPGWVELESQENAVGPVNRPGAMIFAAETEVPEPQSGVLLLGGGLLLCGLSVMLASISHGRGGKALPEKSTICIR